MDLSWMAWTPYTAVFFIFIFFSIGVTGLVEKIRPGGGKRKGILNLHTTRGDRLFLSYLSGGFICLAWLFLFGPPVWWGLILTVVFSILIFTFV